MSGIIERDRVLPPGPTVQRKPHSLTTYSIKPPRRKPLPRSLEARFGPFAKGAQLPETTTPVCPRVKIADLPEDFLKAKWFQALEHNQKIAHCCRHPENHEVAAFKSHPDEKTPDIYIFYCNGVDAMGRRHHDGDKLHRFFCVGATDDKRPYWEAA